MLIGELKRYIRNKKAVSLTELSAVFNTDTDSLELPLKILVDKGFVKIEESQITDKVNKCSSCPMTCKPAETEACNSPKSFNIYVWSDN